MLELSAAILDEARACIQVGKALPCTLPGHPAMAVARADDRSVRAIGVIVVDGVAFKIGMATA